MKKTYLLTVEGKNRDRLAEAAKHDIRKYIKRERAKVLPKDVDFWDFDCQFGAADTSAVPVHIAELFTAVDALIAAEGGQFHVVVVAKPGHRTARPPSDAASASGPGQGRNDNDNDLE